MYHGAAPLLPALAPGLPNDGGEEAAPLCGGHQHGRLVLVHYFNLEGGVGK